MTQSTARPLIPPQMEEAFAATVIRGIRDMFKDPQVAAEFEAWRAEYHRVHGEDEDERQDQAGA